MIEYLLKIKVASFENEAKQREIERKLIQDIADFPWINGVDLFRFFGGIEYTEPKFKRISKAKVYDDEKEATDVLKNFLAKKRNAKMGQNKDGRFEVTVEECVQKEDNNMDNSGSVIGTTIMDKKKKLEKDIKMFKKIDKELEKMNEFLK